MYQIGQVVYAKCGRDKGMPFLVLRTEGAYLYLANGQHRTIAKPKRKKAMHVQPTKNVAQDVQAKVLAGAHLMDSDIRSALRPYE